jgi:microcystin-dependent protein
MSRNGSGTYSLPAGNPVVTATTITSTWANTTLSDIATALTGSLAADGQTPATGSLNMNTNQIKNVVDPTLSQDAATKVYVDTSISTAVAAVNSVVTGTIQMWPTASAPTGYLLCAGAAVSRTTYATLFALIGTTFGVGDGSTTFNVPNYTNRFPYSTTLGATGGSADAVVVSHTHTITDPGHIHYAGFSSGPGGGSKYPIATISDNGTGQGPTTTSTTGITNQTAGVSGTNANLPPYLGINFIIKV